MSLNLKNQVTAKADGKSKKPCKQLKNRGYTQGDREQTFASTTSGEQNRKSVQFIVPYKLHESLKIVEKENKIRNCQNNYSWPHHTSEVYIQQDNNFIAEYTETITLYPINDVPNPV